MKKSTSDNVTDPVCGMTFKQDKAVAQAAFGDRIFYFCTAACKRQFEADPRRYVEPSGRQSATGLGNPVG